MTVRVENHFVIWRDVPVVYQDRKGDRYYGDVPVANWNIQTKRFEEVVNPRGKAYAARARQCYRKKIK